MFQRLRNYIILLTMSIISFVLFVAFTAIYVTTAANLHRDITQQNFRPVPDSITNGTTYDDGTFRSYLTQQRIDESDRTLARLLLTLILTGALTLAAVYFVSRYVADRAIAPDLERHHVAVRNRRTSYDRRIAFMQAVAQSMVCPGVVRSF